MLFLEFAIMATLVLVTIAVIEVCVLTFEWLAEQFSQMSTGDVDELGFTIKEASSSGKAIYIQGVFNKRTEKVVSAQRIKAEEVKDDVAEAHNKSKVAIYT